MDFEEWWEKNYWAIDDGGEMANTIKVYSESAWDSSRDNQEEYQKHEFCRDTKCTDFENGKCKAYVCHARAPGFIEWAKENGYRIVRD